MKPVIKHVLFTVLGIVVLGLIAAPKLLPMIRTADKDQGTASQGAAGKDGQNKTAGSNSGGGSNKKKAEGGAQLRVSTVTVKSTPFAETINATGTLRAEEGVELQAETNGKIVAINFTEGSKVRKGALLLKLNDADLRASLARTTYSKELAKLKEQRYSQLLAQHVVTQNDYDTALSDVNVETANIELYKAQIEKTEIRAPFDGVVGLRYVSMGAFVNAQTRIATLQRLDKLKIDFSVPEKYTARITVGSPITFSVAGGIRKFAGQIYAFDPRIDSGTRTILVRAVVPNSEGNLLPGAFANVDVTLSEIKDALLVPAEAVIPGSEVKNVFVIKEGKAERRVVETGTRTASSVHILAGLRAGDVLITSGLQTMRAGQAVKSIDDKAMERAADESKSREAKAGATDKGAGAGGNSTRVNDVDKKVAKSQAMSRT